MYNHKRYSVRLACLFALIALFTLNVTAFAKNTHSGNTTSSHMLPNSCNYSFYDASSGVFNNNAYNLNITFYNDHCGDFYAVAEGFVPRGAPGGTLMLTFFQRQYSIKTGSGNGPQGAYYTVSSIPTHSGYEDATADFQSIPGGNLHDEFNYLCIRNC